MKRYTFIILVLICALFACIRQSKEISYSDFEVLMQQDSVSDIKVSNSHEAEIKIRDGSDKTYILKIESSEIFQDSLVKIRKRLSNQNIFPRYNSIIYGSTNSIFNIAILLLVIVVFLFIIVLIDLLKHNFKKDIDKLIWFLVIFIPIIGPVLYLIIGRKQLLK